MAFCIIFFSDLISYNNFDKMLPEKVNIDYSKMKYKFSSKFLLRQCLQHKCLTDKEQAPPQICCCQALKVNRTVISSVRKIKAICLQKATYLWIDQAQLTDFTSKSNLKGV